MVWHRAEEHKNTFSRQGNYFPSLYFPFLSKEQGKYILARTLSADLQKIQTHTDMPQTYTTAELRLKVASFMIDWNKCFERSVEVRFFHC